MEDGSVLPPFVSGRRLLVGGDDIRQHPIALGHAVTVRTNCASSPPNSSQRLADHRLYHLTASGNRLSYPIAMAGEVAAWVPIAVAGLGFAGVLGSQFLGSWREDRRWGLDKRRREDERRYQARQDSYAQLLGAVEHWDVTLHPVRTARAAGLEADADAATRLREAADTATRAMGLVVLVAPEEIRKLIAEVTTARLRLTETLLGELIDVDRLDTEWRANQDSYRKLRALMRVDLGFDAETSYLEPSPPPA